MSKTLRRSRANRATNRTVYRCRPRLMTLEDRTAPAQFDLQADWPNGQLPNSPWSLTAGNTKLSFIDSWAAPVPQGAVALGVHGTPAFTRPRNRAERRATGDVVVQTASPINGNGPATVAWISPTPGLATVSGDIWPASGGQAAAYSWTLYEGERAVSTGTLLPGEYSRSAPFHLALGSGGPGAISNITVGQDEMIKFVLTGSQSGQAGLRMSVSLNPTSVKEYAVGNIPFEIPTDGRPISFVVKPPVGQAGKVSMQIANPGWRNHLRPEHWQFRLRARHQEG